MPITNTHCQFKLDDITILRDERQRREIDVSDLIESVRRHGVLQAIIVEKMPDGRHVLIAGERRIEASRQAGFDEIPARIAERLTPLERQLIELLENVKRKDLVWQDLVETTLRIHEINCELVDTWTAEETCEQCFLTRGTVSLYMTVAKVLRIGDERIAGCNTVREAYNILRRRSQRAAGDALQELLETADEILPGTLPEADADGEGDGEAEDEIGADWINTSVGEAPPAASPGPRLTVKSAPAAPSPFPPAEQTILNENFREWIATYTGAPFNIVHCDFPYGINPFLQNEMKRNNSQFVTEKTYEDTPDIYFELIRTLCSNLDKLMSPSSHLIFWYSEKHYVETRRMFAELAPSLKFLPFSLVWLKSDNAGVSGDLNRQPRHVYETAFIAMRGKRHLIRSSGDAYAAPTDKKLHPSCKPEPVLRHFLGIIADDTSTLFDPTAGSGTALRVAEELGCKRVLGLEIDPDTCAVARTALRNARLLRTASKIL